MLIKAMLILVMMVLSGTAAEDPPVPDALRDADPEIVALLKELEVSGKKLRSFTSLVLYEKQAGLLGDTSVRKGSIIYRIDPETGAKSFSITFNQLIIDRRMRESHKRYVFNDRWMAEVLEDEKIFRKHELAPPGETYDPFKLGEGPFPLPIGQDAAQVLTRFDVSKIELPTTGPLRKLADRDPVDGLLLVPKAGMPAAEDIEKIELFYDQKTHLPVGVIVIELNGDRKTARLDDLKRDVELDEAALAQLSVAEPDPAEWDIEVRALERAEP